MCWHDNCDPEVQKGMKKLECIIRPHRLEQVKQALEDTGVQGMTVMEVQGYGRQKGHTEHYRGSEYKTEFLPKVKLDILVADHLAADTITAIQAAARTGAIGDGKISVINVEDIIRIRTGERGEQAL
jgi:nitrogen regulatory protein P-II 1